VLPVVIDTLTTTAGAQDYWPSVAVFFGGNLEKWPTGRPLLCANPPSCSCPALCTPSI
jgi:hypothetical protein